MTFEFGGNLPMRFNIGSKPPKTKTTRHRRAKQTNSDFIPNNSCVQQQNVVNKFILHVAKEAFCTNGLIGLYTFVESVLNNKFMLLSQKNEFIKDIKAFRRNRWLANKTIHKFRNYVAMKDFTPVNNFFLDLTPVDTTHPDNVHQKQSCIKIIAQYHPTWYQAKVYVFEPNELVRLFTTSFGIHDDTCPTPQIPKNPYTAVQFTIGQIIYIFDCFNKQHIRLPLILEIYKTCKFNWDKFVDYSYSIMEDNATREFIQEVSLSEFIEIIYLHAGNRFLRNVCRPFTAENIIIHRKQLETVLIQLINGNVDFTEPTPESSTFNTNLIDFSSLPLTIPADTIPSLTAENLDLIERIENHHISGPSLSDSDSDYESDSDVNVIIADQSCDDTPPLPPIEGRLLDDFYELD